MRLMPRSLIGQVMLVLAFGLLLAQTISAVLLYRAADQRQAAAIASSVAFQLVRAEERSERQSARQARRAARREMLGLPERPMRPDRQRRSFSGIELSDNAPLGNGEAGSARIEQTLLALLVQQGIPATDVQVTRRRAGDDAFVADRPRLQQRIRRPDWHNAEIVVAGIKRSDRDGWQVVRAPAPQPRRGVLATIIGQTILIFLVLFALLFFIIRRMTRPLKALTSRVSDFSHHPEQAESLTESGPADVRQLIAAHNTMEQRIAAMLDEKDVMLGAIGHDLKTPLAALRVRIESVPDSTQRAKMAESIEDITRTLDDILMLARVGRSDAGVESIDLAGLVRTVIAEFEELGEPVSLGPLADIDVGAQETWLKRALRNLVSNALRYAGSAEVSLLREQNVLVLRVEDKGPGIPEARMAEMLEPFQRGEMSRNRATGGAGLGLTLARAIAEQHGGELVLANRDGGGLRADIRLPAPDPNASQPGSPT